VTCMPRSKIDQQESARRRGPPCIIWKNKHSGYVQPAGQGHKGALVSGVVTEIEFDFADERVQIAWPKVRLKHVQQPPPTLPALNEGDFSARLRPLDSGRARISGPILLCSLFDGWIP
jgi:hypothetical protein